MEIPLCISYIRFSTLAQSQGSSVVRQFELSQKYAKEHGLLIDDKLSYRDLGKSAYSGEHIRKGHFGEFLELVKTGKIPTGSVLLVESLDRLSRENVLDAFTQFQTIISEGIKIVTLCDGMEYTKENLTSDFGKIIISLTIMARANEESARKSDRIKAAFKFKRQNLSNKKFTANGPSWLKITSDKKAFEIIEERAELTRRIFQMSYDGMGIKTISRLFNLEKIPAPRSKTGWYPSTVRKMLSSRSAIGEYQPQIFDKNLNKFINEGEPVVDYFPQIVEKDIFYAVQARLSDGTHIAGRTAKVQNLFSGITKCGYCGARMDIAVYKIKKGLSRHLVCDSARRGIKCSYLSFKCDELEEAFFSYCKEIDICNVLSQENKQDQKNLSNLSKQFSAKKGELQRIENQIQIINNEFLDISDALEREHFRSTLRTLLYSRTELETFISSLKNEINQIASSYDDATSRIKSINSLIHSYSESATDDERIQFRIRLRNEIRQIIRQVTVYPRGDAYSDEQVENVKQRYKQIISDSESQNIESLLKERDEDVLSMLRTQNNTKDDRYFRVEFKNGNYRVIRYSKIDGKFMISAELLGKKYDWFLFGKKMKTLDLSETDDDKIC